MINYTNEMGYRQVSRGEHLLFFKTIVICWFWCIDVLTAEQCLFEFNLKKIRHQSDYLI